MVEIDPKLLKRLENLTVRGPFQSREVHNEYVRDAIGPILEQYYGKPVNLAELRIRPLLRGLFGPGYRASDKPLAVMNEILKQSKRGNVDLSSFLEIAPPEKSRTTYGKMKSVDMSSFMDGSKESGKSSKISGGEPKPEKKSQRRADFPISSSIIDSLEGILRAGPNFSKDEKNRAIREQVVELLKGMNLDPSEVALRPRVRFLGPGYRLDENPVAFARRILQLAKNESLTRADLYTHFESVRTPSPVIGVDLLNPSITPSGERLTVDFKDPSKIVLSKEELKRLRSEHYYGTAGEYDLNRARALKELYSILRNNCGFHENVSDEDLGELRLKPGILWKLGKRGKGSDLSAGIKGNPALKDEPYLALRMIQAKKGIFNVTDLVDFADVNSKDVHSLQKKIEDCFYYRNGTRDLRAIMIRNADNSYSTRPIGTLNVAESRAVLNLIQSDLKKGIKLSHSYVLTDVTGHQESPITPVQPVKPTVTAPVQPTVVASKSKSNVFRKIVVPIALIGALAAGESYLIGGLKPGPHPANQGITSPSGSPNPNVPSVEVSPTKSPSSQQSVRVSKEQKEKEVKQLMRTEFARHWRAMAPKVQAAHAHLGWSSDDLSDWWYDHRKSIGQPVNLHDAKNVANEMAYSLRKLTERAVRNGTVRAVPTVFSKIYVSGPGAQHDFRERFRIH